jgi:probable Rubsico expression protein CbbX|tara:strand:+ start:231 stop:1196 length:966 start_codon:yes stop_codon:yes gene_type:complete
MCKTTTPTVNLKDLIIKQGDSIDIKDCYEKTGIENILGQLDEELVGLEDVKTKVREISSVLLFDRIRELQELSTLQSSLHMSFTGRPGTGKTSVAAKIGLVLRNLGFLTKGHITTVTREDMVGQYVGHTAPKTKECLNLATGGMLFIDEAHHLYKPDNERDYGSEAIELILQVMENQREDLIFVFSGGKDKIDNFFNSNPGISSRIGNHVDFLDYNTDELVAITKFLLNNESRYKFTDKTIEILRFYIEQLEKFPAFSNVRTIKIFLNQLLSYQSIRIEDELTANGSLTYESLTYIRPDDFRFVADDFINIIGSEEVKLYT